MLKTFPAGKVPFAHLIKFENCKRSLEATQLAGHMKLTNFRNNLKRGSYAHAQFKPYLETKHKTTKITSHGAISQNISQKSEMAVDIRKGL